MSKRVETRYAVLPALADRWSPRSFDPRAPEPEKLQSIFEAARLAPSAHNTQPVRFLMVRRDNHETYARLFACLSDGNRLWAHSAPVLVLACVMRKRFSQERASFVPYPHAMHDLGLAVMSMILQAQALGVHCHPLAGFDPELAQSAFAIPALFEPAVVVAIGYLGDPETLPDALRERELGPRTRRPLEELVFESAWGQASSLFSGHGHINDNETTRTAPVDRYAALARERDKQNQWHLRPEFAALTVFDRLLEAEFQHASWHRDQEVNALRRIVRFAVEQVPYYADLFRRHGLRATDVNQPEDLRRLPVLSKHDVLERRNALCARALPQGDRMARATQSSGTTGRQVQVRHSFRSASLSLVLAQRHARSYGLDPMLTRVEIKAPFDVRSGKAGAPNPGGNLVRYPHGWRQLSRYFRTGAGYGFNVSEKMERQIAWLQELQPHYAQSYPGVFEEWLFANEGRNPAPSLKSLIGVGSQLTPSLEAKLNEGFGVPVHISYGLNEIGKVAMRCAAGHYHVHTELCLVEIVDENGKTCAPGEVGHVLVTGLKNFAMPLIRYDTGDLAEAAGGECPCGRTLPFFAEIAGRYRRYAGLPEGTRERVRAIRHAIEKAPADAIGFLRRYQLHQDRENRFTLRLKTVGPTPEGFRQKMLEAWAPVANTPLAIVEMDEIATSQGGKLLDFVSDLHKDTATSPILVR